MALKQFLTTLDIVMPRPESLPFQRDAKFFGMVQVRARRRYREGDTFDVSLYGEKVRSLIDDHVLALGVDQKIPPVSITAPDFRSKVSGLRTDRAKASEMEHAVRYHIRKHFDEDPAHYAKLSEKLDRSSKRSRSSGTSSHSLCPTLSTRRSRVGRSTRRASIPQTEAPFYGLLGQELEAEATADRELVVRDAPPAELSPAQAAVLRQATRRRWSRICGARSASSGSGRTPMRRTSCASGSCNTSTVSRSTATTSSSWIGSPRSPTASLNWRAPTTRTWWVTDDGAPSATAAVATRRRWARFRGPALRRAALDRHHRGPRRLADRERSARLRRSRARGVRPREADVGLQEARGEGSPPLASADARSSSAVRASLPRPVAPTAARRRPR